MKLKVCGMRDNDNIQALVALKPDFIGFIFYEKSPRYVGDRLAHLDIPAEIRRVGVFVDASSEYILKRVSECKLDLIQLHGNETVELTQTLKHHGISVMKVFSVMDNLPLESMKPYEPYVDYFLFDTKTAAYGGSGKKFDWSILEKYDLSKPYFLSGGIGLEDIQEVKSLKYEKLFAIDVNSRFEIEPGIKDVRKIEELKERMS